MSGLGPKESYFSDGFRNFIWTIYPYANKSEVYFPHGYRPSKIPPSMSIHGWFKQLVDGQLQGSARSCSVEENMGVFGHLKYKNGLVVYANIQVIIAFEQENFDGYYLDDKSPCSYFRFDYDLNSLGKMFCEPQPHVHTLAEGPPRFDLQISSGNAIIDFFDFIYRNYYYEKWLDWARYANQSEGSALSRKENVFGRIEEAFKAGEHQELVSQHGKQLGEIKRACRSLKYKIFPAGIDHKTAATLSYDAVP